MAGPEVTAEDIIGALDEFDLIGRPAFLAKYGFGEARNYFLRHDGKDYDSKAVVGAAHTRRHGDPLRAADFSGGDATVKRLLEGLGFEVWGIFDPQVGQDVIDGVLCRFSNQVVVTFLIRITLPSIKNGVGHNIYPFPLKFTNCTIMSP